MSLLGKKRAPNYWFGTHAKQSLGNAGVWAALQNGSQGIVQVVSAIILSRLVSPSEFGLLALGFVFYSIAAQLVSLGLSNALIQKQDLSEQQASNFFWVSTLVSAIAGLVLVAFGPLLAWVYKSPELVPLTIVLGLLLCLEGMFSVHRALLQRSMRFDLLCLANLGSGIPALVLAIFMASRGFGVWALVGQLVIGGILMRGWMFLCIQWSPGMYQRGAGIRSMLSFGGRNCAGIAVEFLYSKSQSLILGRFGTITEVGFYNRGQALFQRPFQQLAYPITSLLLPSMSGMQANKKALEAFTVQVMWLLSLLLLPLLVWIINCGEWIAYLLLGDAWLTSGAVMQWLAYAGLLMLLKRPLVAANAALGRPARGICLKLLLIVPFICLTIWASPQGAVAVAIVFALIRLIAFPFEQHLLLQGLGLNSRRLLTQMMQVLLVANVLNLLLAFLTARSVSVASLGAWGSEAGFLLGCLILCYLAGLAIFCIYKDARQVMRMVTRKMMSRLGLSK